MRGWVLAGYVEENGWALPLEREMTLEFRSHAKELFKSIGVRYSCKREDQLLLASLSKNYKLTSHHHLHSGTQQQGTSLVLCCFDDHTSKELLSRHHLDILAVFNLLIYVVNSLI